MFLFYALYMGSEHSKQKVIDHDIKSLNNKNVKLYVGFEREETIVERYDDVHRTYHPYFKLEHIIDEYMMDKKNQKIWDYAISCSPYEKDDFSVKCNDIDITRDFNISGKLKRCDISTIEKKYPGYIWGYYTYNVTTINLQIDNNTYYISIRGIPYRHVDDIQVQSYSEWSYDRTPDYD